MAVEPRQLVDCSLVSANERAQVLEVRGPGEAALGPVGVVGGEGVVAASLNVERGKVLADVADSLEKTVGEL